MDDIKERIDGPRIVVVTLAVFEALEEALQPDDCFGSKRYGDALILYTPFGKRLVITHE